MIRLMLFAWVLLSFPFSVALGRLSRHTSQPASSAWDPRQVAHMLTRQGYRQHG